MQIGSAIEQALMRWRRWRRERVRGPLGLWYRDHGEDRLSVGLPVHSEDHVVDAGGYEGDWAALMAWRYGCRILIIEPVAAFFCAIERRFAANDRIKVVNAAIGGTEGTVQISVAAAGSSIFGSGGPIETVRMCDAADLLQSYGPDGIACLKLNIEGAEYDVLDRLVAAGVLSRIRSLGACCG